MKVVKMQRNSKDCFVCGMENEVGLKAPFYVLDDNSVATVVTFKNHQQSYPDRTHGGIVSTLLDELMGRALWITQPDMFGVTTTMTITYRKPVPLNEKIKARAYITYNSNRGFSAKGQIFSMQNVLLAEGQARYFKIPFEKAFDGQISFNHAMCYEMPMDLTEIDFPEITDR